MRNLPVNKTGYLKGAKTAKNPVNIIPSNIITTNNMAFPIKANGKTLYPNTGQYKFPTPYVVETPLKQEGANELVPDKMSKTKLSKTQEIAYQRWRKSKGYNESDDYDMRGFWKKQGFKNLGSPKGGEHFTDEFKRLAPFSEGDNYPTLSDESNVASKFDKRRQGTWTKDDKYINYQDGSNKIEAGPVLKKAIKEHSKVKTAPKPASKKQLEDSDSWLENAFEIVDPSGLTSWDDVYRSYKNTGLSGETMLEGLGAVPLVGKIGKSGKVISGGFGILQDIVKASKYLPSNAQKKVIDKAIEGYQTYAKYGGKKVDDFLGTTTKKLMKAIPYIDPNSQKYIPAARNTFNYAQTGGKIKDAASTVLGSKDDSGFTYKNSKFKFNGRNIFPEIFQKGTKNAKADYNNGRTFGLSEGLRKRIYDSVNPDEYPIIETIPAIGRFTSGRKVTDEESKNVTQADKDAWAFFMGIPQKEKTITRSKYTPTQAKTKTKYYTLRNAYPAFEDSVISNASKAFVREKNFLQKASDVLYGNKDTPTKRTGVESSFRPLQNVTYSKGKDKKGHYYSIYDTYDFDVPFSNKIGKPYEIYDRVYYDPKTGKPLNRKKQGSKDMKPLIKYKDGSKGVSLSFGRKEKDPKGGLTQKGVDKYNRATGGNLKMAVTTPPSKLKPGSKAANRRKSFCARMSGVKGPMNKNGKPTRKALALRKWNC